MMMGKGLGCLSKECAMLQGVGMNNKGEGAVR